MTENQRKFLLYFQPWNTYWKLTDPNLQRIGQDWILGFYPLSFKDRITQGHYTHFDNKGVPCFPNFHGIVLHDYTTMSSYALGNWELYLISGKQKYLQNLINVADYLLNTGDHANDVVLFLDYEDETETVGTPCAMNQGEAISVLCRAFISSGNNNYLIKAIQAANAFKAPFGKGGVNCQLNNGEGRWYQEAGKNILNGHIYSLFGIYDLYQLTQDETHLILFQNGCSAMEWALPYFDNGYWSWYWLDQPLYIASMMYHNLHICQLHALYKMTGNETFHHFALQFAEYSKKPANRFLSGMKLLTAKARS